MSQYQDLFANDEREDQDFSSRKVKAPHAGVRYACAAAIVVLLVPGIAVALLFSQDRASSFTADAALAEFRQQSSAATPAAGEEAAGDDSGSAPAPAAQDQSATGVAAAGATTPGAGGSASTTIMDRAAPGARPAAGGQTGEGGTTTTAAPAEGPQFPYPAVRTSSGPSHLSRPAAGVYSYRTEGGEETDALTGMKHRYPDETHITLVHTECGYFWRWRPLEERIEHRDFCLEPSGLRFVAFANQREFFGRRINGYMECGGDSWYMRTDGASPLPEWESRCAGPNGGETAFRFKLLDTRPRTVGGVSVEAVNFEVEVESLFEGRSAGHPTRATISLARDTGLPLFVHSKTRASGTTSAGTTATYIEEYEIELLSLEPRT